ncbi:YkgJ family cysteine cluster protein [Thermoproteota archaeon]
MEEQAKASISRYCMEECKAYCCRKGYLLLTPEEKELIAKDLKVKKLYRGDYSLALPCPMLKDNKCSIHDNPKRPKTCKDFPIFITGNKVRLSPRCLAVKEGKLYPFERKFLEAGYRLE